MGCTEIHNIRNSRVPFIKFDFRGWEIVIKEPTNVAVCPEWIWDNYDYMIGLLPKSKGAIPFCYIVDELRVLSRMDRVTVGIRDENYGRSTVLVINGEFLLPPELPHPYDDAIYPPF